MNYNNTIIDNKLIIKGTLSDTESKVVDLLLPAGYNKDAPIQIETETEKNVFGIARYSTQTIATDGLCIMETNMYAQKDIEGILYVYGPHILLTFHFDKKPDISQKHAISGNIDVHFATSNAYNLWLGEKDSNYMIGMVLSRDYYLKLCKENEWIQHFPFFKAVKNEEPFQSEENHYSVNVAIKTILTKILINPYSGLLKRLYIDTKIKSLLSTLAEQEHNAESPFELSIQDETTERLYQAKQILENNIQNPPTIKNLSRMVLLNEMKLKQGFKDHFKMTIRNYVIKLRMETAHNMMTHENTLIFEVAMRLGYKDTSHFITAFKSYFGYTPKYFCTNIRQSLKVLLPFFTLSLQWIEGLLII